MLFKNKLSKKDASDGNGYVASRMLSDLEKVVKCVVQRICGATDANPKELSRYLADLRTLRSRVESACAAGKPPSMLAVSMVIGSFDKLRSRFGHVPNMPACAAEHSELGLSILALWELGSGPGTSTTPAQE